MSSSTKRVSRHAILAFCLISVSEQSETYQVSQVDAVAESNVNLLPPQSYQDISEAHMAYLTEAPDDVVTKLSSNKEAKSTVSIMSLLGSTYKKLQAARFIMGDSLDHTKFKTFLLGIEEAEGASKIIRDMMSRVIKKTSEVLSDVPSGLKRLRKSILRLLEKHCSLYGRLSGCRNIEKKATPDFDKQLKEIVDPLIDESAEVPDITRAMNTYEEADGLFKKVLKSMTSDLKVKGLNEVLDKSESRRTQAIQALTEAEHAHLQAGARLNAANANIEVTEKAAKLQMSVVEMYQKELTKAENDLKEIEERLRKFTFNMYSLWTSFWENDVKLAEKEKKDKRKEIEDLRMKIEHAKKYEAEAAGSGYLAQLKSEQATASQTTGTAWETVLAKRQEVEEANKWLQDAYDRMAIEAEKYDLLDVKQVRFVKAMATTLQSDSALLDNINKAAKENLYKSLAKVCKIKLQEMKDAEYIHEQLTVVDDLLEEFPKGDDHDFEDDTKALVTLYRNLDRSKFFKLAIGGMSQEDVNKYLQARPCADPGKDSRDVQALKLPLPEEL